MKAAYTRHRNSSIPSYNENAVLQLIIACGVGFIAYHLTRVILLIADANPNTFPTLFTQNLALPELQHFASKFWTVFTYGWVHNGFWELFSNMIWLYSFGSVVQMLVGYKQVIPLFFYSLIAGGIFFEVSQLVPLESFHIGLLMFGAQAGVIGMAVAALTIQSDYRVYLGDRFSIPLVVIAAIFFVLAVMNTNLQPAPLCLLAGGALMGFIYVKLLKAGYRPGIWIYDMFDRLNNMATPDEHIQRNKGKRRSQVLSKMYEPKQGISQKRIDDILDKINQKGYNSLTSEEKEVLLKASKDEK